MVDNLPEASTKPTELDTTPMLLKALQPYHVSKLRAFSSTIPRVPLYIGGKFVESKTEHWIPVHNPATQELVSFVPQTTKDELEAAVSSAAEAFKSWKKTSIMSRQGKMFQLQALIKRDMDKIAGVITTELGKTQADAKGDVLRGLQVVEHACSITTLQMGEMVEGVTTDMDTYSIRQPLGVCAGITPFNFPAMIPLWMFPLAIVCIGEDNSMVFGSNVGLDTLAISRPPLVNILTDTVRSNKGNRLNNRTIADKIYSLLASMDNIDDTGRDSSFFTKMHQVHGSTRITLARLQDNRVTTNNSQGEHPEGNHGRKVEGSDASTDTKGLTN